jgi:ABC-type transporter Mla MlaB component
MAFTLLKKTRDAQAMLRIEKMESEDLMTFVLSGRIQKEDLGELKGLLEKHNKAVVLDLKGVKLIDREAVIFLANFETDNATITNCPPYIREWIRRERGQQ